jgi:trans-2-enoyl-CoA reductase
MQSDVQEEVASLWQRVVSGDASAPADFEGYRKTFLEFHGFGVEGVDYDAEVDP